MMNIKGTGYLLQDGKKKFSGDYDIELIEHHDAQAELSATIKLSGIKPIKKYLEMINKPSGPYVLVIAGNRRLYIDEITHIPGSENFDQGSGSAEFKIWFTPGANRLDDDQKKSRS
jgi:hypothetical protein